MKESEFEQIFSEFSNALFRHALFRVGNREKAIDLSQDTFIKAWNAIIKGEEVREWKPFLFRILNNLIIDHYRSKKTVSLDALDESIEERGGIVPSSLQSGGMEDEIERFDVMISTKELMDCLVSLSPQETALLTARCIDEIETGEVAKMLGISESAVYVRTHRALKSLKKVMEDRRNGMSSKISNKRGN